MLPKIAFIIISVLVGAVVVLLIVSQVASVIFNQKAQKEVREFFADVEKNGELIKESDLEGLPPVVHKWLTYSGVVGKERITSARSRQTAEMRMKKENPWMPLTAKQYFTVDQPGYIWIAKVKAAPLVHIAARDKYHEGRGNVLIKLASLITVADSRGPEIDQGSLVRYLAETVWIPGAALSSHITWEKIDVRSARATMSYGGVTASGVFSFNDRGEVTNFTAQRYGDFGGQYSMETWTIQVGDYREFDGIRVPTRGDVTWKLKTRDFHWYRFTVEDMEYNKPVVYQD